MDWDPQRSTLPSPFLTEATIARGLCNWRLWLSCGEGQEEGHWEVERVHVGAGGMLGKAWVRAATIQPAFDLGQHLTTTTILLGPGRKEKAQLPHCPFAHLLPSKRLDPPTPGLGLSFRVLSCVPDFQDRPGTCGTGSSPITVHLLPPDSMFLGHGVAFAPCR